MSKRVFIRGITCRIEGCAKPSVGNGWCCMHYMRWKRHGDVDWTPSRQPIPKRECPNCKLMFKPPDDRDRVFCNRGCRREFVHERVCRVDDCDKTADTSKGGAQGYCAKHKSRLYRHGDPLKTLYAGKGFINDSGYRILSVQGQRTREHRKIVEQHLGRKLESYEICHHINGDKLDNRIGNLQVMTRREHVLIHRNVA